VINQERTQAVENCTGLELHSPVDPSVGDLCEAMFIEGARLLGYAGEALMPTPSPGEGFFGRRPDR
jgi:hypothetical protein